MCHPSTRRLRPRPPLRGTPAPGHPEWRRSDRPRSARRRSRWDRVVVRCARPGILPRRVVPASAGSAPPLEPMSIDVQAHITGTVWKVEVGVGDQVDEGDTVVILESIKMEMPVEAEDPGKVAEIRCEEGQSVSEGDVLVVLE